MRNNRLLPLALGLVLIGATELFRPQEARAASAAMECIICIPPVVMCMDPSDFDSVCMGGCGSLAASCPAPGVECSSSQDVLRCN